MFDLLLTSFLRAKENGVFVLWRRNLRAVTTVTFQYQIGKLELAWSDTHKPWSDRCSGAALRGEASAIVAASAQLDGVLLAV